MSAWVLRTSSVANVVFGVLIAASAVVRLAAADAASAAVAPWLAIIGAVFGIFGLSSLYLIHGDQFGVWGPVAFVPAMTGLALSVAQFYGLTFALPGAGPLGPLFPLGYGPFLFGFLLLDGVLLTSRTLPRVAVLCLIAGAVLNAAGFATPEVRLFGVVTFGAGIAWLGSVQVRRPRESPGLLQPPGAAQQSHDGGSSVAA